MHRIQLGPSILTADFNNLGDEIRAAEAAGCDFIHLDVMDGQFVPNITFGPMVVDSVRAVTSLPLDVHLMIIQPERFIDQFVEAGADAITVHVESTTHLHATISRIRSQGAEPGVTLNPLTPLTTVIDAIPFVDRVLVMSVNPGFGGQSFIPVAIKRIEELRAFLDSTASRTRLEIDGGVKASNIARVAAAGADMIVAGSAVFRDDADVAASVQELRSALERIDSSVSTE